MKRVLEMDGGHGCTIMRMYSISLNCTAKMTKIVNYMLCVFYNNLKNFKNVV